MSGKDTPSFGFEDVPPSKKNESVDEMADSKEELEPMDAAEERVQQLDETIANSPEDKRNVAEQVKFGSESSGLQVDSNNLEELSTGGFGALSNFGKKAEQRAAENLGGREKLDEMDQSEREKHISEAAEELAIEDKVETADEGINALAEQIWADKKIRKEKIPILNKALQSWADKNDPTGLSGFLEALDKARVAKSKGKEKEWNSIVNTLSASGLGPTATQKLLSATESNEVQEVQEKFEDHDRIIEGSKHDLEGIDRLLAKTDKIREEEGEEAAKKAFDKGFKELAKDNKELQRVQREVEEKRQIREEAAVIALAEKVSEEVTPKSSKAPSLSGGAEARFNGMSEAGKTTLSSLTEKAGAGGSAMASDILQHDVQVSEDGTIEGRVSSGPEVRISNTGALFIIGEHAGDAAKQPLAKPYPVDPPTPNTFNDVHRHMIVQENGISSLAKAGFENALEDIAEGLTKEDQDANILMTEDAANRLHNFLVIILGDNINGNEEESRLRELGIVNSEDSFAVDGRRVDQIREALALYTPQRLDADARHDMPIDYDSFKTLVAYWKHTSNDAKFPPLGDLKALNKISKLTKDTKKMFDLYQNGENVVSIERQMTSG